MLISSHTQDRTRVLWCPKKSCYPLDYLDYNENAAVLMLSISNKYTNLVHMEMQEKHSDKQQSNKQPAFYDLLSKNTKF